jgi:hypothetical protein
VAPGESMSDLQKIRSTLRWLPSLALQSIARGGARAKIKDVVIAVADHFEPAYTWDGSHSGVAPLRVQEERMERWADTYPRQVSAYPDSQGFAFRHTYFYPAEQYDHQVVQRLAAHCHDGWGEVEVHLHHGISAPDTPENTRAVLTEFRDRLVGHGCLARWEGTADPRFAFVHGNWALANSGHGKYCGVDNEIAILAEAGCYADFTLPSAPDPAQISTINSIYEPILPLHRRAAHRKARHLTKGTEPRVYPLFVQGPLALNFRTRRRGLPLPRIENGAITANNPPTAERFELWLRSAAHVRGTPSWAFVKLHCHGMDPRDEGVMLGDGRPAFLRVLLESAQEHGVRLHFVTAREMVNIILAACDGREGCPSDFRDYRLRLLRLAPQPRPE